MPFFIPKYDSLRIHELMLSDSVRTQIYRDAIAANVARGDIVVDVGTGTGVLALFAAEAGAGKVYAIEPTGIIDLAKRIAERNGLGDRIEFIRARAEEVDIPERVDCIVSEWLGVFAVQENMLPNVASVRDRFLKPEGKMLPEAVGLFLALVEDKELYHETIGRWRERPYGLDYTDFASCQANDVHVAGFSSDNILSDCVKIIDIDMKHATESSFKVETHFKVTRDGICHGLGGWFQAVFPGGIVLDTAPERPLMHWRQAYFPIPEPVCVKRGEEVVITFTAEADDEDKELVHFIRELVFLNSSGLSFVNDTRKVKFSDR